MEEPSVFQRRLQLQAIAEADALVDLGLQSGRWTRQQQDELGAAIGDLDVKEQSRILARVSKAINDGQLKFDPSRKPGFAHAPSS